MYLFIYSFPQYNPPCYSHCSIYLNLERNLTTRDFFLLLKLANLHNTNLVWISIPSIYVRYPSVNRKT